MTVGDGGRLLVVKPTFIRVVGWATVIFALFCATGSWRAGAGKFALFFLLFGCIGVYLLLFAGTIEMDSKTIVYRTALVHYQIRWDEVTRIELDKIGYGAVFWGENKRLAALGPYYWQGADRMDMLLLLAAQIDKLGIKMEQSEKAMFRLSKNTKVRV